MTVSLCVRVLCLVLVFGCSSLPVHPAEEERAGCFALVVYLLSGGWVFSMSLRGKPSVGL